jgi:hypothetical protein
VSTELRKFEDAYASIIVAVYEPLILRWVSSWGLATFADVAARRVGRKRETELKLPTALSLVSTERPGLPDPKELSKLDFSVERTHGEFMDDSGRPSGLSAEGIELTEFPEAMISGGTVYPRGATRIADSERLPPTSVPVVFNQGLGELSPEERTTRATMLKDLLSEAATAVADDEELAPRMNAVLGNIGIYSFLPEIRIEEALSPIGIAHFYRQLYFNAVEGYGPIEEAFTVAPKETLEVLYQSVKRQIHEEVLELGFEQVSESATEEKNVDEVSDKVSTMIQRDSSAAMSANASGSIGVWQVGASASASFDASSQRGREQASRRLKEVTTRAAERITKSTKVTTRDVTDLTTTTLTRRVLSNDGDAPVSFGLRRILRRVDVKVQDLGPRLVWQLYIRNPGAGLAQSRFVHFRPATPVSVPELPPGMPPRPQGGTDTGSTSSALLWDSSRSRYYVTMSIQVGADRAVTSVSIDNITDLEGGGKDDLAPSPLNSEQWDSAFNATTGTYSVKIAVLPGDAASVSVNYTFAWRPSDQVLNDWETLRQKKVDELTEEALNQQFEREKKLITAKSKIRHRPAADLRREERYEVLSRMVTHLFARGTDGADPSPLEIEYFHRFFEIDAMFTYTHPSWWRPRYAPVATGFSRPAYEITDESEPAPLGSSLGWMIQLDGDSRRSEFLNSPWVRVCVPMRPAREQEAVAWLASHVEGEVGYDTGAGPLKNLLAEIAKRRDVEEGLGIDGPDYVTVDSTVGDEPSDPNAPLKPSDVYPIVQEFEVTVPTEGFVYDEIRMI